MEIFRRFFGGLLGLAGQGAPRDSSPQSLPTVAFDASMVTREVEDNIRATIAGCPEIPTQLRTQIYDAAVLSVCRGRDQGCLAKALREAPAPGLSTADAARLSRLIHNRASALMAARRQERLGIENARWLHSGAPCFHGMEGMEVHAKAHANANGKRYRIKDGLVVGGARSWPGREDGCMCVAVPIVPGIDP